MYPFLFAALLTFGAAHWAPLILAGLGSLITAWLLAGVVWRVVAPESRSALTFAAVIHVPLLLAVNTLALPLTGMEHTLHMAASVAVVIGLFDLRRETPVSPCLLIAIILALLIHHEGLALAGLAVLALLWHRKFIGAALVIGALAIAIGAFSYMLHVNGQPVLPSSVLAKSHSLSSAMGARVATDPLMDVMARFGGNFVDGFGNRFGTLFGVGIALMFLGLAQRGQHQGPRGSSRRCVSVPLCLPIR